MSKLLGRFDICSFYELTEDQQEEHLNDGGSDEDQFFINCEDDNTVYNMGLFMRSEGRFDGVMGLTNTSAIGCVLSSANDQAVLQLLY